MRCKLQPELRCAGSSQIRVHMLTHSMSCSLSSIRGRKPRQWTPRLCHALTYLLFFISWIPQITLALPHTSPHMRPFPWKREAENIHAISHALLSQFFFLFHRRALRFEPIRRQVRRTRPWCFRACRAKRFGPRTQLRRSSSNYLNQVREVKVCPIKNELSSPIFFFRFAEHPELGSRSKSSSS